MIVDLTPPAASFVLVIALLAGACSSTSKPSRPLAGNEGSPLPSEVAVDPSSTGEPVPVPGKTSKSTKRSRTGKAGSTGPAAINPAIVSRIPARAPGADDKVVLIGIEALTNLGPTYALAGVNAPQAPTDEQQVAIAKATLQYANDRGGFAGRTGVPLMHFTDIAQGTHSTRAQAACAHFTEDNAVFAVIAAGNTTDAFPACLAKAKRPLLEDNGTFWPYDEQDLTAFAPYLYLPTKLNMSRFRIYIDSLAAQGFFDGNVKIGLLRYDMANHVRIRDQVIKPALARHGKSLADEFAFTPAQTVQDLGRTSTEANSAVLQFKGKIDRVLYLPTAQVVGFTFPAAAEGQNYRPKHGINSAEGPFFWTGNVPAGQLENTYAVGWRPLNDLGQSIPFEENPLWKDCAAWMVKQGQPAAAAYFCAPVMMLKMALDRAPEISPAGLRAGMDKLGTTQYSSANFATALGPGRYDGPGVARDLKYETACKCFKYVGPNRPIS